MKPKKEYLKAKFIHFITLLLGSIILGYLLLVLVYAIPQSRMVLGSANSICTFQREGNYPTVVDGYINTQLDNYTDGAMLNVALCSNGDSPWIAALKNCQYKYDDKSPMESFMSYLWQEEGFHIIDYPRYWHGFLVFLKPLLLFFSYSDIRMLNGLLQSVLIAILLWQLVRKQLSRYILPTILTTFYLVPSVLAMSLQYSSVYYIALTATVILLLFEEKLRDKELFPELFLMTGVLTSYFDLLTYPLITLGFPLIFIIILEERRKCPIKKLLLSIIGYSLCWGIGYVGMWSGKWLLSILFLGASSFTAVASSLQERSLNGAIESGTSVTETIISNLEMFKKPIYKILPVVMLLYTGITACFKKSRIQLMNCIPFLLPILIPFAWYVVTANHASVHTWFTHKTLCIAVLGYFCMLAGMTQDHNS